MSMILYSDTESFHSHRTRIVVYEKDIEMQVRLIGKNDSIPEDILHINGGDLPTFTDRDLAIWGSQVIMEYLDERFPHPTLMPIDPVTRGRCRLMLYRIEQQWLPQLAILADANSSDTAKGSAKSELLRAVMSLNVVFEEHTFFMNNELTLVDVSLAAFFWRAQYYGLKFPARAKPVIQYMLGLFKRPAFRESLTDTELEYVDA